MGNHLVSHPSFYFFITCTEVNTYLAMEYFRKTDETFMNFKKKIAKALIKHSYMNQKTCGSPEKTIKRKISHILDTAPTHATDYNLEKWLHCKKNNTSSIDQNVKINTDVFLMQLGNLAVQI